MSFLKPAIPLMIATPDSFIADTPLVPLLPAGNFTFIDVNGDGLLVFVLVGPGG